MIITNIAIKNFLGIGEINIDLSKYTGITLIEGVNHDSPTSISNGASKSSLMESVYYCLYGKTKRGYSGDEVVNTFAKKD
ncbi:MAG: exonuclease, partial [Bacteroidia bacterium]|nr:exonuclease [Bacteroidia bacterium]